MSSLPEPWLRGAIVGVHPITAPFLFSMTQAREDLDHWVGGLSVEQLWARPLGLSSVGFQVRHIGCSIERLATYLRGGQLNEDQLADLKREADPGASFSQLFGRMEEQILWAEAVVKAIDPRTWNDLRQVGRKALPTTVGGLVTHIAEHTQRHVGQAIVISKVVRALAAEPS